MSSRLLKITQLDENEVLVNLIYPHWRSGTLPLSSRLRHLFPTAYEAPRIRFVLVDGDSGEKFPAWVVPEKRYVFGLRDWYTKQGLVPGSQVRVRHGAQPGEVIIDTISRRSSREMGEDRVGGFRWRTGFCDAETGNQCCF